MSWRMTRDLSLAESQWRTRFAAMKAALDELKLPPYTASDEDPDFKNLEDYAVQDRGREVWDFISDDDEYDEVRHDDDDHDDDDISAYDFAEDGLAGPSSSRQQPQYGVGWLTEKCVDVATRSGMSPEALQAQISEIITSAGRSEGQIQSQLTDLIGFDDIELVVEILANRSSLTAAALATAASSTEAPDVATRRAKNGATDEGAPRLLTRAEREQAQRQRDHAHKTAALGPASEKAPQYPHVYKSYHAGNTLSHAGKKYGLPAGSERRQFDKYEEYYVPPATVGQLKPGQKLVQISELDGMCRGTFKGYKTLNRMQSLVYPVAYRTSENMLICAPTGAGKTDAAMLTILHTIGQYATPRPTDNNGATATSFAVDLADFKIVYVAPMKALAAEVTEKLGRRLGWLGVQCREYTGDMQLTKAEIVQTQIIVTTPEKWDVVTRRGTGDTELVQKVRLLIIDEVHMLHDERGAVLESLVARTQRQVESTQLPIRIVGLSATLPNYVDVADFLRVNLFAGLFFFDASFRPVPLEQHFIGVKGKAGSRQSKDSLDGVAFEKVREMLRQGHQVMVFVHSRRDTLLTARMLHQKAADDMCLDLFDPTGHPKYDQAVFDVRTSRARDIRELVPMGLGIHHAGMARADRNLMERFFAEGVTKVLCCTATLAWGVNLPAAAVVIKGTQVYSAQDGKFVDLGILDVLQIFGRAGRPQFEDVGIGMICTTSDKLAHYLTAVTEQQPIESRFSSRLVDNLNAEVALGTVTSIAEAAQWISYSYLFVRMRKSPLAYGIEWAELRDDPMLVQRRQGMAVEAARTLQRCQMAVLVERTGELRSKDIGRIASQYYIRHDSIRLFNAEMRPGATEADALSMLSRCGEFDNIQSRDNEAVELTRLRNDVVPCDVDGGIDQPATKTNVLLQAHVCRYQAEDFALGNDLGYVAQQSGRICRALFLLALNRRWGHQCVVLLTLAKAIERRVWPFEHPLRQFELLPAPVLRRLDEAGPASSITALRDMDAGEIGALVHNHGAGRNISRIMGQFPTVAIGAEVAPLSRDVLRMKLTVTAEFVWNDRVHGTAESFHVWVENPDTGDMFHHEYVILSRRRHLREPQELHFTIPLPDLLPAQILVRAVSDRWLGAETVTAVSFRHLIRPDAEPVWTDLLDLRPLPVTALADARLEALYRPRFRFFNPMQTQVFHTLYHTAENVLLGSPTGSGKTVAAELALWWARRERPGTKVVYVAPMKALVRERVRDWGTRLTVPVSEGGPGLRVVELTGDSAPDAAAVRNADVIVTTPEKWDGISRGWRDRSFVRAVSLVVLDEVHLLAGDRGPVLEAIVSRLGHMAAATATIPASSTSSRPVRLLAMSTACANAADLAAWLGVRPAGVFNFRHSVRPVPLELFIDGFPDVRGFCPLMQSMNRPTFLAIKNHSPDKPAIVFVPSRRQTRLTARDLINLCALEDNPRRFVAMDEDELQDCLVRARDDALRESLSFGIGLHHAGLAESDRRLSERLFLAAKIQVLVATSTLAWGVNLPAHLVVVKGTQFYDARAEAYRDMDLTDVLQMLGRAGRPQFDSSAVARILTQESRKDFYKHFLHTGFPVESSLHKPGVLPDHLAAEIAAGAVTSRQGALDHLTSTFFFRRLHQNPSYYGLDLPADEKEKAAAGTTARAQELANQFLAAMVDDAVAELEASFCVESSSSSSQPGGDQLVSTTLGRVMSRYYLSHRTIRLLVQEASAAASSSFANVLSWVARAAEYDELPVRHNEDVVNADLARDLPFSCAALGLPMGDPHVKAFLLLQAHMARARLPIADYVGDQTSVLDQATRVVQAAVDVLAELGQAESCRQAIRVMQCIKAARLPTDPPASVLPGVEIVAAKASSSAGWAAGADADAGTSHLPLTEIASMSDRELGALATRLGVTAAGRGAFVEAALQLPVLDVDVDMLATTSVDDKKGDNDGDGIGNRKEGKKGAKAGNNHEDDDDSAGPQLTVSLRRRRPPRSHAYLPQFPKPQTEGWFIMVTDVGNAKVAGDLLAVRRVAWPSPPQSPGGKSSGKAGEKSSSKASGSRGGAATARTRAVLALPPKREVSGKRKVNVWVMSDCYVGVEVKMDGIEVGVE